jgi:hypothetical protein
MEGDIPCETGRGQDTEPEGGAGESSLGGDGVGMEVDDELDTPTLSGDWAETVDEITLDRANPPTPPFLLFRLVVDIWGHSIPLSCCVSWSGTVSAAVDWRSSTKVGVMIGSLSGVSFMTGGEAGSSPLRKVGEI